MVRRTPPHGFTLIELLVVLAISALMMLVAAPLTKSWADTATVRQAVYRLNESLAQAKALALRNTAGKPVDEPAAFLLLTAGRLCIFPEAPKALSCAGEPVWQMPVKAAVTWGGQTSGCIALNNQALLAKGVAIAGTDCGNGSYVVSHGNGRYPQDGSQPLY